MIGTMCLVRVMWSLTCRLSHRAGAFIIVSAFLVALAHEFLSPAHFSLRTASQENFRWKVSTVHLLVSYLNLLANAMALLRFPSCNDW